MSQMNTSFTNPISFLWIIGCCVLRKLTQQNDECHWMCGLIGSISNQFVKNLHIVNNKQTNRQTHNNTIINQTFLYLMSFQNVFVIGSWVLEYLWKVLWEVPQLTKRTRTTDQFIETVHIPEWYLIKSILTISSFVLLFYYFFFVFTYRVWRTMKLIFSMTLEISEKGIWFPIDEIATSVLYHAFRRS